MRHIHEVWRLEARSETFWNNIIICTFVNVVFRYSFVIHSHWLGLLTQIEQQSSGKWQVAIKRVCINFNAFKCAFSSIITATNWAICIPNFPFYQFTNCNSQYYFNLVQPIRETIWLYLIWLALCVTFYPFFGLSPRMHYYIFVVGVCDIIKLLNWNTFTFFLYSFRSLVSFVFCGLRILLLTIKCTNVLFCRLLFTFANIYNIHTCFSVYENWRNNRWLEQGFCQFFNRFSLKCGTNYALKLSSKEPQKNLRKSNGTHQIWSTITMNRKQCDS